MRHSDSSEIRPVPADNRHRATTLADILDASCLEQPAAARLRFVSADGSQSDCSYPQLRDAAMRRLGTLQRAGLRPGDTLLLQLRDPRRFLEVFWACQLGAIVPVPATPALGAAPDALAALAQVAGRLDSARIAIDAEAHDALAARLGDALAARLLPIASDQPAIEPGQRAATESRQTALMLLTSGSTGAPKLVTQSHRALIAQMRASARRCGIGANDVSLNWLPLEHVGALVMFHLRDLMVGAAQVQAPMGPVIERPETWLDWLESFGATVSWAPHFAFARIAAIDARLGADRRNLRRVRCLINAGEPIFAAQARDFLAALAPAGLAPDALWPAWGMSETCSGVCFSDAFRPDSATDGPVDLGPPIDCLALRVVDEADRPLPDGKPGALQVRGDCVTGGYHGDAQASAAAFTPDGWFRTGDIGVIEQGRLRLTGRAKDVLIVSGRNIACTAVEQAAQAAGGIQPATAIVFEALADGAPVLVFAPIDDDAQCVADTRAAIRRAVASACGLQVERILPVAARRLPRSAIGKIQRAELARMHARGELASEAQPVPAASAGASTETAAGAAAAIESAVFSPTESALASIWTELLGQAPATPAADYFELGGQSLIGIRLAARVQQHFGAELSPIAVFEAPSLRAYAALIDAAGPGRQADTDAGTAGQPGRIERSAQGQLDTLSNASSIGSPDETPADRRARLARLLVAKRRLATAALPPRPATPVASPDLAATPAQASLWLLDHLPGAGSEYNVAQTVSIEGALDEDALAGALQALVDRHDALRAHFDTVDGEVRMRIEPRIDIRLEKASCDARLSTREARDWVERQVQAFADHKFELNRAPLLRAQLLRLDARNHRFTLVVHHIVSDGWSLGVIARDLGELYAARLDDRAPALPPLQTDYAGYARWQLQRTGKDRIAPILAYWRGQLAGLEPLSLPTDRPRTRNRDRSGGRVAWQIDRQATEALRALARGHGATLYMVLLAAFQTLLMRHAGRTDIAVGSPVAGRGRLEFEPLVGYFVNMLVLRTDLSGDPGFAELLARARSTALDAFRHDQAPFDRLVGALAPRREFGVNPLFQVSFALQNTPAESLRLAGTRCELARVITASVQFDLQLTMTEVEGGLDCEFEFATALFERDRIERMADHLRRLVDAVITDASTPIGSLPMIGDEERRRLLAASPARTSPWPADATVCDLFEAQAARHPQATALVECEREISYRELDAHANRLANRLVRLGVGPGATVAFCLARGAAPVIAMLATLKAGGAYLPLDPSHPPARRNGLLADAGCRVLLSELDHLVGLSLPTGTALLLLDAEQAGLAAEPAVAPAQRATSADLAYLLYTSGSTGRPKGVMIGHRALVNHTGWLVAEFGIDPQDAFLHRTTPAFDAAGVEIWPALLSGARLVLADDEEARDPRAMLARIRAQGVSRLQLVPGLLGALSDELKRLPGALPLRTVFVGGDVLVPADADGWLAQTGIDLVNLYGPTECTIDASFHRVAADETGHALPIGRPVAGCRIHILDASQRLLPLGVDGEICISGLGLARGYLGRPELDAERFVANPFADGEDDARLYRSGDLGRVRADGVIEYLGRIDRQLKIRGYRIEPGEIESALRDGGAHQAVVLPMPDGAGGQRLVAWVEPAHLEPATLRERIATHLPQYMLPAAIVALERLPLLPNGKLDLQALPAPQAPRPAAPARSPASPTETAIAAVWCELLGRDAIELEQDFFDIGGNSLLAARAAARIGLALGTEVSVASLFEAPSIAALAARLDGQAGAGAPTTVDASAAAASASASTPPAAWLEAPATPAQRALCFLDEFDGPSSRFNMNFVRRLHGVLDVPALERALQRLAGRHEALRTSLGSRDGESIQLVHPEARIGLRIESLAGQPLAERDSMARRLLEAHVRRPFRLADAPLARALLVRLGDDAQLLQIVVHHIVCDGWSLDLIERDLAALYREETGQGAAALPPAAGFTEHARAAAQALDGGQQTRLLEFWRNRLAGMQPLVLPADLDGSAVADAPARIAQAELPASLGERLGAIARTHGATPFVLLLSAFDLLLSRLAGVDDIVIGTPIARRERAEQQQMVGYLLDTMVLRTDLSGNPRFDELLERVRTTVFEAFEHNALAYDSLVAALKPARMPGRDPIADVSINQFDGADKAVDWANLSVTVEAPIPAPARSGATLYIRRSGAGQLLTLACRAEQFTQAWAEATLAQFLALLRQIADDPTARLDRFRLDSAAQGAALAAALPAPPQPSVLGRIAAHARARPQDLAFQEPGADYSYGQLAGRAGALAHRLADAGVTDGQVVGIHAPRGFGFAAALLAAMTLGAVPMPLDPALPAARRRAMCRESGARVLVAIGAARWPDAQADAAAAHGVVLPVGDGLVEFGAHDGNVPAAWTAAADPDAPAYLFFTSGSTGIPKGVLGRRSGLDHFIAWQAGRFDIASEDRVAQWIAPGFDAVLRDLFLPMATGGTACLPPDDAAANLPAWLQAQRISVMHATPSMLAAWLEAIAAPVALERLRWIFLSGEPLDDALVRRCRRLLRGDYRIVNLYGPTETTMVCCHQVVADPPLPGVQPIGVPIDDCQVLVLRADGRVCGVNEPGELVVRTPFRTLGYLNAAAQGAARFRANPARDDADDLLYHTGDIGRLRPDGTLVVFGRSDDQVKIRGVRVEPAETAAVLADHPAVARCAVLARPGPEGELRLVAWVVPATAGDAAPSPRALVDYLQTRLPAAFVPAAIGLLDSLPLLPNGKLDRKALPEPAAVMQMAAYTPPRGETERQLALIWQDLLGVARVGRDDDFFALGGHSLMAGRIVARTRRVLDIALGVRVLFDAPTLAGFAAACAQARAANAASSAALDLGPVGGDDATTTWLAASSSQQALWYVEQLTGSRTSYHVPKALRIEGAIDPTLLRKALAVLAQRHELLRAGFETRDGQLCLQIHHEEQVPLSLLDAGADVRETAQAFVDLPFDLEAGPPWRAALIDCGAGRQWLVLVVHHIVSDGWSIGVLKRELGQIYSALHAGCEPALAPLPAGHADFIEWQQTREADGSHERSLTYWRERLAGLGPLELPTDRPRGALRTRTAARIRFRIEPAVLAALKTVARRRRATPYMALLAAWQAVLARHSGQSDFAVGTPVAGRSRPEFEPLVGYFVNMLVMRAELDDDPDFDHLLERVQRSTLDALEHQALPFDRLVGELAPQREAGVNPLFQVSFALQNAPSAGLELPGARCVNEPLELREAKFDLALSLGERDDGLDGALEYASELFDAARIERLVAHFGRFLAAVAARPDLRASEVELMDADERAMIARWSQGEPAPFPADQPLAVLFEAQVRRAPQALAVACGELRLSYAQLNRRANRIAHRLRQAGIGPDQVVALCMPRSEHMLIALLGIIKAGAAYLPLDPQYPAERLRMMVQDACPALLLRNIDTPRELDPAFEGLAARCLHADAAHFDGAPDHDPQPLGNGASLAYLMYTSGSTGQPKGTLVTQRGVARLVLNTDYVRLGPDDVLAQVSNVSFDAATFEIWGAWLNGGRLEVLPSETVLSHRHLAAAIRERSITTMFLTTALFNAHAAADAGMFGLLANLVFGGEAADPVTMARVLGSASPPARLLNGYGPTETTTFATAWPAPADPSTLARETVLGAPIGRPIANTSCHVLDAHGRPQPIGVVGELFIGGPGVALGYLNRPELSAERFVADPGGREHGPLYRTGDLVRWRDDGTLLYAGRNDQQVKIRGYRIELGEIDAALRASTGVREAATLLDDRPPLGKRLVAFVVPTEPAGFAAAALRTALRGRLPEFMLPAEIRLCERLPITANGKLDRKALIGSLAQSAGATSAAARSAPDDPLDATTSRLLDTWRRLLGRPTLGLDDHFFEAGGHSLLALRMLGEVERDFGRVLRVATLFEAPTARDFAALLRDELQPPVRGCAVTIQPDGAAAPLFIVSGYGSEIVMFRDLARALGPDQPLVVLDTAAFSAEDVAGLALPDVAALMLADLRRIQPEGPYHLAGYSLGGKFVYEIARQLRAAGHSVALLALLDCNAPGYPRRRPFAGRLIAHARQILRQGPAENIRYLRQRLAWAASRLRDRDLFENAPELAHTRIAQAMKASAEAMFTLWQAHEPGIYDGRLVVVRAALRHPRPSVVDDDPCLGWKPYIDGPVDVRDLDADHLAMLRPAHADALAALLGEFLGTPAQPAASPGDRITSTTLAPAPVRAPTPEQARSC